MHARVAWVLTALTCSSPAPTSGSPRPTGRCCPRKPSPSTASRSSPPRSWGAAAMGALIVARWARHPIGWLLCLIGFLSSISLLTEAYSVWVATADGPGSRSLGGMSRLDLRHPRWTAFIGRAGHPFPGRAGRPAPVPPLARRGRRDIGGVLRLRRRPADPLADRVRHRPAGRRAGRQLCCPSWGCLFIAGGLVAAMVSMVLRLRHSRGVQRQQLRLIALSAAFIALSFVFLIVVQLLNGGRQTWISSLPLFVSYFCLPLLFAVAVLRYRLFDLDLIINRAVVLALGTILPGSATPVWSLRSQPCSTPGPVDSGCRYSPPRWSRSPSSRSANGSSGSPTGWPTGQGRCPTRRCPSSAVASRRPPSPTRCCLLSQRRPGARFRRAVLDRGTAGSRPGGISTSGPARPTEHRTTRCRSGKVATPSAASASRCRRGAGCGPRTSGCCRIWPTRPRWLSATPRWRPSWPRTWLPSIRPPRRWRSPGEGSSRPTTPLAAGWSPRSPARCCPTYGRCPSG